MRRLLRPLLGALLLAAAAGCGNREHKALRETVERNVRAAQEKNIDLYLEDMTEELRPPTRVLMTALFKTRTLSYKLTGFRVVAVAGDRAKIETTVETRWVSGPPFRDNRTTAEHLLRKEPGGWKFLGSSILNVTYLRKSVP